ncbi:glycosyltransferase, partial [Gottfriedia acidiceleris]|uniref:glycosyltransferase n=1 Tax=Gottfriedia acidiceleris TaxID=371036 RepID=UPI0033960453
EDELNLYSKETIKENNTFTITYTGNLGLAQDLNKFLAVAKKMRDVQNITFKILGYGKNVKQVHEYINQNNLHNVELLSARSRNETLLEVSKADIAYVSLVESDVFKTVLPGKIIDYMCMKKPIIADVSGYAEEIIQHANCGYVLKKGTLEEMVDEINNFRENPSLRIELGENGYQYAYHNLRWKTNINKLVKVMEGLNG